MGLLGAVLRGAGGWMVHEAQVNEEFALEQAKADILTQREMALENLRAQHTTENTHEEHLNRLDEIDQTGINNRANALVEGEVKARIDAQSDQRDLEKAVKLKGLDLSNDKQLEAWKHKNKLTEDQAQSALDIQRDAAAAHTEIDRIVFSKNGQLIAYKKDGSAYVRGRPGDFNPSGSSGGGDDLGDYLNSGGAASGSSLSRTQAQATPKLQGNKGQALAQLSAAYAQAKSNPDAYRSKYPRMFDDQGNLLPRDQVVSRVNQYYGQ